MLDVMAQTKVHLHNVIINMQNVGRNLKNTYVSKLYPNICTHVVQDGNEMFRVFRKNKNLLFVKYTIGLGL